jgi:hypothetical protein
VTYSKVETRKKESRPKVSSVSFFSKVERMAGRTEAKDEDMIGRKA